MSKINDILRNGCLVRLPAHDLSAASETANANTSLQAIFARTPTFRVYMLMRGCLISSILSPQESTECS
jgi:hypothetical protein